MRNAIKILGLALLVMVTMGNGGGCDDPDPLVVPLVEVPQTEMRFTVKKVGRFNDSIAYEGKRGIYIITDNTTGTEYLGVSGIGISELGSHSSGKSTKRDER